MKVVCKSAMNEGIPCLMIEHEENQDAPVCVLYHGWGSNKNTMRFFGEILALYGFRVIIPDAPFHGERGRLDYFNKEVIQNQFWKVIMQTVGEFEGLVRALSLSKEQKVTVIGSSMGGFSASGIFARYPEDTAYLVNLMAEDIFRKLDNRPMSGEERDQLRSMDPLRLRRADDTRPVLFVHGNKDETVPIGIQQYAYSQLLTSYSSIPEHLKFVEIPNAGHTTTLWMIEEIVGWLRDFAVGGSLHN
ncbi:alpha/beta hydrolase [Fictibacillus sp. KIGAM418]|uniref:Alpha/beta hydrolase n=1 Tax=Fictibacillus marinisediminis TaxID=2878389 RepID=A0A9X2BEY5_9BACL|nr:alpha/beta fold hydrolase [Fictibacillus marinisediminis]MCK6259136.1 alpha/beta hydrolase [Fictibacillus marinisediminis]